MADSGEFCESGGIGKDDKSGDSCLYGDSGDSDEFSDYGEHCDFNESGDPRQHGESVDSVWFGDFGVYNSGESYGLTYKYLIIWSRVSINM